MTTNATETCPFCKREVPMGATVCSCGAEKAWGKHPKGGLVYKQGYITRMKAGMAIFALSIVGLPIAAIIYLANRKLIHAKEMTWWR